MRIVDNKDEDEDDDDDESDISDAVDDKKRILNKKHSMAELSSESAGLGIKVEQRADTWR